MFNLRSPQKHYKKLYKAKFRNIPLSVIVFGLTSQLCFGINFGFAAVLKKKIRKVVKYITFIVSIGYIAITILLAAQLYEKSMSFFSFEYIPYFVILNTGKYTICNLVVDVSEIYIVKAGELKFLNILTLYYTLIMFLIKTAFIVVSYHMDSISVFFNLNIPYLVLYCIPSLGLDMLAVSQIIVYYFIFIYVRDLNKTVKKFKTNLDFTEKRYKDIADCVDKIRPLYDKFVSMEFEDNTRIFLSCIGI